MGIHIGLIVFHTRRMTVIKFNSFVGLIAPQTKKAFIWVIRFSAVSLEVL
jgi:hypothetical protein